MHIPPQAQSLITNHDLGTPTAIYRPDTLASIIVSPIFIAIGIVIGWLGLSLTNTPLLPPELSLFHVLNPSPSYSPSSSYVPGLDDPMTFNPSSGTIFTAFGIIFLLVGLLFVVFSLRGLLRAFLNRHVRAVVCTNGVAYVMRKGADAFRWEQILRTFNNVSVRVSTTNDQYGDISKSIHIYRTYTVYCHDGRKFVFDSTLRDVEKLAEEIEVGMARAGGQS